MKANYELTRIGIKLKTSLLLLLLFLAAVFQLQAQVPDLISDPASGHYCIEPDGNGVHIGVLGGSAVTYTLWKDNFSTGYSVDGTGSTVTPVIFKDGLDNPIVFQYGAYTLNGVYGETFDISLQIWRDVMPVAPESASATLTTICSGGTTTISATGGSGTTFAWYKDACGTLGTFVASSTTATQNVDLTPTTTTTYYGRWENVTCGSECVSVTITVENLDAPTLSADETTICLGGSVTLTPGGGSLYTLYTDGCKTGAAVTGTTTFTVTPLTATPTTYWVTKTGTVCGESACASVTITVNPLPAAPTSLVADDNAVCSGTMVTLTAAAGTPAQLAWYEDGCGTGSALATGTLTFVVTPTVATHNYYVRAENGTCSSACLSTTVNVYAIPDAPTSAVVSPTSICSGSSTSLIGEGGGAAGSTLYWYLDDCGTGSAVASGTNTTSGPLTVSPTNTITTYNFYARYESLGGCVTTCKSATVTVYPNPTQPVISISPDPICIGSSTTLSVDNGPFDGSTLNWYKADGTLVASGTSTSTVVSPTTTTGYYARWENTGCNSTPSAVATVTVTQLPLAPESITSDATDNRICIGGDALLTAKGGGGSGGVLSWYSGLEPCGSTPLVGSASSLLVTPTTNTIYFAKYTNGCGSSSCASITICVDYPANGPTGATASPTVICEGTVATLTATGTPGTYIPAPCPGCDPIPIVATLNWYSSCVGGIPLGTGTPLDVTPTTTTIYYAVWENACGRSATCASVTVTVNNVSEPTSLTASPTIVCAGNETTLEVTFGQDKTPYNGTIAWYSSTTPVACGGGTKLTSTSTSITVSPTVTTYYYVRTENIYGGVSCYSNCSSTVVTVIPAPTPLTSISGVGTKCNDETTTVLTAVGGASGNTITWYKTIGEAIGTCGSGDLVKTSTLSATPGDASYQLVVSPTATAVYYASTSTASPCAESTCVSKTILVTDPNPTPNPIVNLTPPNGTIICKGGPVTLEATLPYGAPATAVINWYSGNQPCGGTWQATGTTITVYPQETVRYFARSEGGYCDPSGCVSITLTVSDPPVAPTVITLNPAKNPICRGDVVTLTANGSGGVVYWGINSCPTISGTLTSTGSLTVTPTTNTDYYAARYIDAICGMSVCASVTVTVEEPPTAPTAITSTDYVICNGETVILTADGSGAMHGWFASASPLATCPSFVGSVTSTGTLTVSPTVTTYYYVATYSNEACGWSNCASVTITVAQPPATPTSITATPDVICNNGMTSTLQVYGHTLGAGEVIEWYTGYVGDPDPCVGHLETSTTTATLVVAPTLTTRYFAKYNNMVCPPSGCASVLVTVSELPQTPTSISGTATICTGGTATLTATYNSTGAGISLKWYTNSSCTSYAGTGSPLYVSPVETTTYWACEESANCPHSGTLSVTVTVNRLDVAPTITSAAPTICENTSADLTATGGGTLTWYKGSCGGTYVNTGGTISTVSLTTTTTFYVRSVYACGNSICSSVIVTVQTTPAAPAISATNLTMCSGSDNTLTAALPAGAPAGTTLEWYAEAGCVTHLGSGTTLMVSPTTADAYHTSTIQYYVRAENACDGAVASITITINPKNLIPTLSGTSPICNGSNVTLTAKNGGGLILKWYTGSQPCDDNFPFLKLGDYANNTLTVSPTITSVYFAHYEGGVCRTSPCASILIEVVDVPQTPTLISATDEAICKGGQTTVSAFFNDGAGVTLKWYEVAGGSPVTCSSTPAVGTISGNSIIVTPTTTTTYFASTYSNPCGNSNCLSITITVDDPPAIPTVAPVTDISCSGETVVFTADFVGNHAGNVLHWYSDVACTLSLGEGNTLTVSPTNAGPGNSTVKYYVRAESPECGVSGIASVTLTVRPLPLAPTLLTPSKYTICNTPDGDYIDIVASRGVGDVVYWYNGSGPCGGAFVATGTTLHVAPTITTIYFAKYWSNECGFSPDCSSVLITVTDVPVPPDNINATETAICNNGSTSTLSTAYTPGAGVGLQWFQFVGATPPACSTTSPAVGVISGSAITVAPTVTTTYYAATYSAGCGYSACKSITITVSDIPTVPTSISATLTNLCVGGTATVTATYNSGAGISLVWRENCTGSVVGTGSSISVSPGTTTTYYARTESASCPASACLSITINVFPVPSNVTVLTAAPSTICVGSSTTITANGSLTTGATLRLYTGNCGGTLVGTTTGTTFTVSPAVTTTYFAQWGNDGCVGACKSVTVTVIQIPTPPTSLVANPTPVCRGQATTISADGGLYGTTLNWYSGSIPCQDPLVATGTTITVYPQINPTQYSAHWINQCFSSTCVTVDVYIVDTPVAPDSITVTSGTNPICYNGQVTLHANFTSVPDVTTIKWYKAGCGGTVVNTGLDYTLTLTQTATYYVRAENNCGESACASLTVVVSPVATAPTITSANNQTICENTGIEFRAEKGAGLTLNWYSTCGGTTPIGTDTPFTVTPTVGTTTYYARMDSPPCAPSACASITVTVLATPVAPTVVTATPNTLCGPTATTVLHANGSGATLNWYNTENGTSPVFTGNDITVTPTYTRTLWARYDNGSACKSGSKSVTITVLDPITNGPGSITASDNQLCYNEEVTLTANGTIPQGAWVQWYSTSCGVGPFGSNSAVITVNPPVGTTTYYARYENNDVCVSSACASVTITKFPLQVAPTSIVADPAIVCANTTTTLTAAGYSGGTLTWYAGTCGSAVIATGNGAVVTVTGTTTFWARTVSSADCYSACASVTVTTYPAIVAPTAYAVDPDICIGESTTLMRVGGSGDVLNWYTSPSGGTPFATNVNSVIVSPIVTTTYYVRWESSHGCPPSAMAEVIVRVQTPQPVISGPQSLCAYNLVAPYNVIDAPQPGHVYVWEVNGFDITGALLPNGTTQGPTPTNTGAGSLSIAWGTQTAHGQIRVTETNEYGCTTTTGWYHIYMAAPLAPLSITGPDQICQNTVQSYQTTLVAGATQYNWTVPTGWSIQAGAGTYSITVLVGTVSGNVTVVAANTCGASVAISKAVVVDQVPVSPGTITGDLTPCQNESGVTYSVVAVVGNTYAWTYSGTGVTFTGDGTASIVAAFANNATAGTWTVYASNTCGTGGYSTLNVTPDLLPGTIGTISGTSPVCQGVNGVIYTVPAIANVPDNGYTWTVPVGATISGTTTTNQIVVNFSYTAVTGNVTVFGTNPCGISATASKTVTVNPIPGPAGTITGNTTPCQGQANVAYSVPAIDNATSYFWVYSGTGATMAGQGTSAITLSFANNASLTGNLTVYGINSCGNGTISAALAIVVSPLPGAAGTITGDSPVCQNTAHTYTVPAIANATSYTWAYTGTNVTYTSVTNTNEVTLTFGTTATAGNLTVYGSNNCGVGITSAAKAISVNPMPLPIVFGDDEMCAGTTGVAYYTTIVTGYTYEWVCFGGEIKTGQNTAQITVDWGYGATGSVYVIAKNTLTGCDGQSPTFEVTLNPLPAPVISGSTTVTAYTVEPYSTPNIAGNLYTWTVNGGSVTSGQYTSQIEITWGAMGSGTVTVFETNPATGCIGQTTIPVTIGSAGTLTLTGVVRYDNNYNIGLRGVNLALKQGATVIATTTTTANGNYEFTSLNPGTYTLDASFNGTWDGVNATDANLVEQQAVGILVPPLTGLRHTAGDVNASGGELTMFDGVLIKQRFVGQISSFTAGDWVFDDNVAFTITSSSVINLKALCVGDVNGSNIPATKALSFLNAVDDGVITVPANESFNYEIRSNTIADLGAMSLILNFDQTRFNVEKVNTSLKGMEYKITDGRVAFAWSDTKALSVINDAPIISLQVTAKESLTEPSQIFTIDGGSEFADQSGIRINNFDLKMASVVTPETASNFFMYNYPNPFRNMTEIVYSIPEDGKVTLVMTNMYGQTIRTLVDEAKAAGTYKVKVDASDGYLNPGVYLYRIEVEGTTNSYNKTNKMMLTR